MIKVAVLWIISDNGKVLLAQRAHHKAQDPSTWGPTVTGKLEPGETFDQALVREVEEELGLRSTDYQPTFLFEKDFNHPDGEQRKFHAYYTVLPKNKTDMIHFDANEVAGLDWFSVDTILEKMKSNPSELVPSANAVWPGTFQMLKDKGVF